MKLAKKLLLMGKKKAAPIVYLFRDEFTTPEAGPIATPHTCEPGPGSWTVTQTTGAVTINASGQASLTKTSSLVSAGTLTYVDGIAVVFDRISGTNTGFIGFKSIDFGPAFGLWANGYLSYKSLDITGNPQCTPDNLGLVTSYLISIGKVVSGHSIFKLLGKVGSDWKLLFVDAAYIRGSPTVEVSTDSATMVIDNVGVTVLGAPWNTDYGIITARVAAPSDNETLTGTSDGIFKFDWTVATNEVLNFMVRRTDDDNCWIVRCDQANSTIKIIQKEAGTETERASAAYTWTNATKYRLTVIADTQLINVYVDGAGRKLTYASAAFNQTATGVKVSGFTTGANLEAWPRIVFPF